MLYFFSKLLNLLPEPIFLVILFIVALEVCFLIQLFFARKLLKLSLRAWQVGILSLTLISIYFTFIFFTVFRPTMFQRVFEQYSMTIFEMVSFVLGEHVGSSIVSVFLIFIPLTYGAMYFLLKLFKSRSKLAIPASLPAQTFILTTMGGLSALTVGLLVMIGLFKLQDVCQWDTLNSFHQFNSHVKNLCAGDDKSLCPQNEDALRGFNPQAYRKLEQCSSPSYTFDQATLRYEWTVPFNGGVLSGSSENEYEFVK